MNVLVLSNLYPPDVIGGYELCCGQMVQGLRDRGHEVTVLTTCPRQPYPLEAHVERCFRFANCFDHYTQRRDGDLSRAILEAHSRFVDATNVFQLLAAMDRAKPDLVYIWNVIGLGGLALVATLSYLGVPWVWHLGDCVPRELCSLPGRRLPVLTGEFNRSVRGHYLAVSRRVIEEIEESGVELRDHVELVPNWVIGQRPPPRERFFRGGTLRIVSAGQLSHVKGTELLIDAARWLLARGETRFQMDLYGLGPHARYQRLIREAGVENHVHLRGELRQRELWARYAEHEYDLFAFPTWSREPFGTAPMEAAAHGVVMLISESCGIAEWFVDGVHCLKAERTAAAFAERIRDVLAQRTDLAALGRLAATTIWRDFHLDAALDRVERAFASAVAQHTRLRRGTEAAYRLALLAEKLVRTWVQNAYDATCGQERP